MLSSLICITESTILSHCSFLSLYLAGFVPVDSLISSHRTIHDVDFNVVTKEELQQFEIPMTFLIEKTGEFSCMIPIRTSNLSSSILSAILHGLAGWFDISFNGTTATIVLPTAPENPGTHWYQCRMLFKDPIAVNRGRSVVGCWDGFVGDDCV